MMRMYRDGMIEEWKRKQRSMEKVGGNGGWSDRILMVENKQGKCL
jgi:hypothetical protein